MFIAALFTIAKTWKQPKCPFVDKWILKLFYIYIYIHTHTYTHTHTHTLTHSLGLIIQKYQLESPWVQGAENPTQNS